MRFLRAAGSSFTSAGSCPCQPELAVNAVEYMQAAKMISRLQRHEFRTAQLSDCAPRSNRTVRFTPSAFIAMQEAEYGDSRRKRVTKACDQCSRRRRKCEGGLPACAPCAEAGKAKYCTYTKPTRRRGPAAGYSVVARTSAERLRVLHRALGHSLLLCPEVEELLSFAVGRRDTCPTLLTPITSEATTEEAMLAAWRDSALSQYLEGSSKDIMHTRLVTAEDRTDSDSQEPSSSGVHDLGTPVNFGVTEGSAKPTSFANTNSSNANQGDWLDFFSGTSDAPVSSADFFGDSSNSVTAESSLTASSREAILDVSVGKRPLDAGPAPTLPALPSLQIGATPNDPGLPNERTINILLDTYLNGACHASLPIVDKESMLTWSMGMHHAKLGECLKESDIVSTELVFAILATALPHSSLGFGMSRDVALSVDQFRKQADFHLSAAMRRPTLGTVQSLILLSLVDLGLGDIVGANNQIASALALATDLGLHRATSQCYAIEESKQVYLRRTFYSILVVDTMLALRVGRCPFVRPSSYDCTIPSTSGHEEVEMWRPIDPAVLKERMGDARCTPVSSTLQSLGVTRSAALSTFVELARLCVIASNLLHRLHSPCSRDILLEHAIPDLDAIYEALSVWETNLPGHFLLRDSSLRPTHKTELSLFFHTFALLCLRSQSSQLFLDSLASHHLLRSSEALVHLLDNSTLYTSRPYLYSFLHVISSNLISNGLESLQGTRFWVTAVDATRQLFATYPDMARLADQRLLDSAPPFLDAQSGGDLPYLAPDAANSNVVDWTEIPAQDASASAMLPDSDSHSAMLTDPQARVAFDFDFLPWTDPDEVLRSLGVRGPTRPSSPLSGNAGDNVNLLGRWSSQAVVDEEWKWVHDL